MKLLILFAQRKCNYEGQYAPEALEIMTEYGNDDNPEYLREKLEYYQKSNEFIALKVIPVLVKDKDLDSQLFPDTKPIIGTI